MTFPVPGPSVQTQSALAGSNVAYDIAINGMPFMMVPTLENPYVRTTAAARKQQLDTSSEPGEQTLSQWWTRVQDSWHKGAGVRFYDPGSDETTKWRFGDSLGVDVWTKGQFSLLNATTLTQAASGSDSVFVTGALSGTDPAIYFNNGGNTFSYIAGVTTSYTVTTGGTPSTPIVNTGTKILVGTEAGISSADPATTWDQLWTIAPGAIVRPWWVKQRIIASRGPDLWELSLAGGAMGTVFYSHPDSGWTWTSVVDSPGAILAAGYGSGFSAIYTFALVDAGSGGTPTLGSAVQEAEMPFGEEIQALCMSLGTYLGIATTRGIRVGTITNSVTVPNRVQFGPLVVETTNPVLDLVAGDRFIYGAVTGQWASGAGAVRIDLSQQVEDLRFAWAWDVQTHSLGTAKSIALYGTTGRVALGTQGSGLTPGFYLQNTNYEATGYLSTGRIRYATAETKQFARLKVRGTIPSGTSVDLFVSDETDTETANGTLTSSSVLASDVAITALTTPQQQAQVRLLLHADGSFTHSPVISSVSVKALPVPEAQRTIRLPLTLADREADRNGVQFGIVGGSAQRLFALEALESSRALVQMVDAASGETATVSIQSVEFTRRSPRARGANQSHFEGDLVVTVLKV